MMTTTVLAAVTLEAPIVVQEAIVPVVVVQETIVPVVVVHVAATQVASLLAPTVTPAPVVLPAPLRLQPVAQTLTPTIMFKPAVKSYSKAELIVNQLSLA